MKPTNLDPTPSFWSGMSITGVCVQGQPEADRRRHPPPQDQARGAPGICLDRISFITFLMLHV